jgi:Domain of unknown function (DUF4331)
MSSHREAPGIAKDPVADNTDLYAFVSPDNPNTVTIIANFVPLEYPPGGPNFFEFGDDVTYVIHISNDGHPDPDISYRFQFNTRLQNPNTFLYNTGQILSLDSPNWNRRQFCKVSMDRKGQQRKVLASNLPCPPCNVGPRSIPDYDSLADSAIHTLDSGEVVFTGQRNEGFYVDLGSIFDLGDLRPFQHLHLIPSADAPGVDGTRGASVHTIAIQVPKRMLTRDGSNPSDPADPKSVVGVWASAYRRKSLVRDDNGHVVESGPWTQVSRLGNPLFNEVVVPMARKDEWNAVPPSGDKGFQQYVLQPELAKLLPVLYPGVFPNLAGLHADRADLAAILLTGIPSGLIPGFQNFTGPAPADMLRLNMAIPPAKHPKIYGLLDGDIAGFPNGRRPTDDVTAIELRAIAGVTYPLVDPNYTPDAAAGVITDGTTPKSNPVKFLQQFPYMGVPISGFDIVPPKSA